MGSVAGQRNACVANSTDPASNIITMSMRERGTLYVWVSVFFCESASEQGVDEVTNMTVNRTVCEAHFQMTPCDYS